LIPKTSHVVNGVCFADQAGQTQKDQERRNLASLSLKDAEIEQAKAKMDSMADQFAQMLRVLNYPRIE
jgi:hypothetical protein